MKKLSKILVLLLTVSMILSLFAVFASADGQAVCEVEFNGSVRQYPSIAQAFNQTDINPGSPSTSVAKMKLLGDTKEYSQILHNIPNTTIELDLNGYTLTAHANGLYNGNGWTITNSVFRVIGSGTKLVVKNGTITAENTVALAGSNSGNAVTAVEAPTEFEFENVNIKNTVSTTLYAYLTDASFKVTNSYINSPDGILAIDSGESGGVKYGACNIEVSGSTLVAQNAAHALTSKMEADQTKNPFSGVFYDSTIVSPSGTIVGWSPAAALDHTSYYEVNAETGAVTLKDMAPMFKFYNTNLYANGSLFDAGAASFELNGGRYVTGAGADGIIANGIPQVYQVLSINKYVDGENTYYPSFEFDPGRETNFVVKGLYDAVATATLEGETITAISVSKNAGEGAVYQTKNGYVYAPTADAANVAALENAVLRAANTGFAFTEDSYESTLSAADSLVIAPAGDFYHQFVFAANLDAAEANTRYEILRNLSTEAAKYTTLEIDLKTPALAHPAAISLDLAFGAAVTGEDIKINTVVSAAELQEALADGKWHNFTFVVDHGVFADGASTLKVYVFVDGALAKTVAGDALELNWVEGSDILQGLVINCDAEQLANTGLAKDNFNFFSYTDEYEGFLGLAEADELTDLAEFTGFSVKPTYVASIGEVYYEDINAALEAAGAEDVVDLCQGFMGMTEINAAGTINTNGYEFTPISQTYKAVRDAENSNVITFVEADAGDRLNVFYYNDIDAYWDDDLIGEYTQAVAKYLTNKGNVVGDDYSEFAPPAPGEGYLFNKETGKLCRPAWGLNAEASSYDDGILVYTPAEEEVEAVYVITDANGAYLSHGTTVAEFNAALVAPKNDTTLVLLSDVGQKLPKNTWNVTENAVTGFTLDLNGHLFSTINNTNAAGLFITHPWSFTVTSSRPGAVILSAPTSDKGVAFIHIENNAQQGTSEITIDGENITWYGSCVVNAVKTSGATVNINGGRYVQTKKAKSTALLTISVSGVTLNAEDAVFEATNKAGSFMLFGTSKTTVESTAKFDNCKILSDGTGRPIFHATSPAATLEFNDCFIYGWFGQATGSSDIAPVYASVKFTGANFFVGEKKIAAGYPGAGTTVKSPSTINPYTTENELVAIETYSFELPHADVTNSSTVTSQPKDKMKTYTFTSTTSPNVVDVTLTYGGEVKKSVKALTGTTISYEETLAPNGIYVTTLRGSVVAGETDTESEIVADTVVKVSGLVYYNITLANDITLNLAIPADIFTEIESVKLGGVAQEAKEVVVGNTTYYVVEYKGIDAISMTKAIDFVIAGKNTEATAQTLSLSVAGYAKALLKSEDTTEKELARSILAYALAAEKLLGIDNEDAIASLETALAGTTAPEAVKSFGTSINTIGLEASVLSGASLQLGRAPAFAIILDNGVTANTVVKVSYTSKNGDTVTRTFTLNATNKTALITNMKVYDLDNTLTIEVGGASYTYDLVTYLNALCELASEASEFDVKNEAFANALWNYVQAADAYKTAHPPVEPQPPVEEPGDEPGGEQPGGEQPGGEQPGGEQPGGEQTGGEQTGGEQTGGEQTGGEQQ